jgi:hypothetical protein
LTETIDWHSFEKQYKPQRNPYDKNASFDGYLMETYGEEMDLVHQAPTSHVWTVVDSEESDDLLLISGYHYVNRIGYILTELPHYDKDIVVD